METTRQHAIARRALWLAVALAMALAASVGLQAATQQQAFAGQAKPKVTLKSPKKVTVVKGETFRVKAKASKGAKVTFKSSKKAVASVSKKGKVKAKRAGKTTISVIAKKGKRKTVKKVKVSVVKPEKAQKEKAARGKAPRAGEPQREEPAAGSAQQPAQQAQAQQDSAAGSDQPAQQDPAGEPDQTGQQGDPTPDPDGTENTDPEGLGPVETYTFTYPCSDKSSGLYIQCEMYEHLPTNAELSDVHVEVAYPDGTIESCDGLFFVNSFPGETPDNCIYINSSYSPIRGYGEGQAVFTVTYREVLG